MLKQMREGAKSTVLKLTLFGMLLMAMTGLALMDVQGMFRSGIRDTTAATYKGGKITTAEFDRLVQSTLRQQNLRQSDAYKAGLPRQILQQEIDSRLFALAADNLGLRINDAEVARQIKQMISPLTEKGVAPQDALQRLLQTYGLSEGQLVSSLKSQIATQELTTALIVGARAPQQLAREALRWRHESRRGEYFRLTAENAGTLPLPSDDQLKSYYDSIAREYAVPERRTLSVIMLDKKILGGDAKVSDEKLKKYYEDNIVDYRTPEKRTISQIIANDEESAKAVFAAAEKTKDMAKAAAAAGKGKASYIKSNATTEGDMPVELSKAAFMGKAGAVLSPLKSPLGWHILYIEKVAPGVTKPFESVKEALAKDMMQDTQTEALYSRANEIDDEIAGGKSLSEVAKENKVPESVLENIDVRGLAQNGKKSEVSLPLYDKLVEAGFKLKEGTASRLIETPEGAFMIVAVKNIFPAAQQPFDKVRAEVLARWKTEQQVKTLSAKAAQISERLKKGESFDKIAADLKQSVQTTELMQRTSKTGLDKNLQAALFSLEGVGATMAVSQDGGLTLLRLAERSVQVPKTPEKSDVEMMDAIVNRALQQDILDQYRMHLMASYKVRINDALIDSLYAPKDENQSGEE